MPPPSPPRTESPFASSVRWPAASPRRSRSTSMTLSASIPPSALPIHFSSATAAPPPQRCPRDRASHAIRGRKNDPAPRERERRRGRVRAAGRREGEMSGDRRRSLVGRGRDGERSSQSGRETRTAVKDGPSLGIYRTISHAHSSLCFPEEGPGFMRGFLIIAIHRHPLVPFFARSQRLFESSPPSAPARRENRTLFNCSSSHFSSAIYLATAIVVR